MSSPAYSIEPPVLTKAEVVRPIIDNASNVLPDPVSPTIAVIADSRRPKETSSSTCLKPLGVLNPPL
jgi:hypothetical protein